jgi:ribosomal protein L13E
MSLGQANTAVYLRDTKKVFQDGHDWTGRVDNLEQAIAHAQEAVDAAPPDHLKRVAYLNDLGYSFGDRYGRTGSIDDLAQAITHA